MSSDENDSMLSLNDLTRSTQNINNSSDVRNMNRKSGKCERFTRPNLYFYPEDRFGNFALKKDQKCLQFTLIACSMLPTAIMLIFLYA